MNYEIRHEYGHYIIVDDLGNFICSCDTFIEAEEELQELLS